ncbi:hypothetical protein FRC02_003059 [Tulasnella sp. 418]|nr:hypothetical protein FRC02_003059 [Tulasnella sp. 418]
MLNVQNAQEKVPHIEQQSTPTSPSSTVRPPYSPVSPDEVKGLDLALPNPRPWERDTKGLQFLNSHSVSIPEWIRSVEDLVPSTTSGVLLFTLPYGVIMYYVERKTFRQIDYGFRVKSTSAAHNLSPDGNTLVRWILNEEEQTSTLLAIDVSSKKQIAELQPSHQFKQWDILNAIWVDDFTIYIPVSADGIIIPWNIRGQDKDLEDLEVIEPIPSITCHRILKFDITKNRLWWTVTGTCFDPPSGLIEVHDVGNDEGRIVEGMVSCIVEVEFNGEEKALLVSAGISQDFKLQLCVQQLDLYDPGKPFPSVDVRVDTIEEKDYPRDIIVLHPLPIVVVMTENFYSYFFELNTGAYLYSQVQESYQLVGQSDRRGLLLWSHEKSDVQVLTVNEGDLIVYCREVLKDDSLAGELASRTGLSEVIIPKAGPDTV